MNPNYVVRVKEEIEKLLGVGFIQPMKKSIWLSPIVVVPKKNGKIRVSVDYRKLNVATVMDAFAYSQMQYLTQWQATKYIVFLMDLATKIIFQCSWIINKRQEWDVFVTIIVTDGLKTTLTTFQRIIVEVFSDYIPALM